MFPNHSPCDLSLHLKNKFSKFCVWTSRLLKFVPRKYLLAKISALNPTSFSPVISTKKEINPKNILTFSFNAFTTLAQNFKAISIANPKSLNLNQECPLKKLFFLVKSLYNWGYNNFSHRNVRVTKLCHKTTSAIKFEWHDKILLVTSWTEIMTS